MAKATRGMLVCILVCLPAVPFLWACDSGADGPQADAVLVRLVQPRLLQERAPDQFTVRFRTTAGDMDVGIVRNWSPRGADRFYNLVAAGYFDGVYFHRVMAGYIAGFGIHPDPRVNVVWNGELMQDDPPMVGNTRGRLTFAQSGPNSRTSELFFNLADNPALDELGYTPVGEVTVGVEVLDSLFAGYGDGPPRGDGPYGPRAESLGNAYFQEEFPELDRILRAWIVSPGTSADSP
jgi:peptidyl-prolyl cis-trans isomerase A (cyclophilin A)